MGFDFESVNEAAWERPNRKAGTDAIRVWSTEDKNGLRLNLRLGVNVLKKMGVSANARLKLQLVEKSDGDYLVMLPAESESYKLAMDKEGTYAKLSCRVSTGSSLEKVDDFRGRVQQMEVAEPGGLSALKVSDRKQEEGQEESVVSSAGNEPESLYDQSVEEGESTQEDDDGNASGGENMEVSTANPVDVAGGNKGFHSYSF